MSHKPTSAHSSAPSASNHPVDEHPYAGRSVGIATKHHKARMVAPAFANLGAFVQSIDFDTDTLGTFTPEVPRQRSALETAVEKARIAATAVDGLGLGSEGSFGPHPALPFVAGAVEILAWVDLRSNIVLSESITTFTTNFAHRQIDEWADIEAFVSTSRFPTHAVILRSASDKAHMHKGLTDLPSLRSAFADLQQRVAGPYVIETDMRAHLNPTRAGVIAEVATKLVERLTMRCATCSAPGWGQTNVLLGLLCGSCGTATDNPKATISSCARCGHKTVEEIVGYADPQCCAYCNP